MLMWARSDSQPSWTFPESLHLCNFYFLLFFSGSLHFTVLPRPRSIYGFTELFFLHAQGQAVSCVKTIQKEQDAEKLPT